MRRTGLTQDEFREVCRALDYEYTLDNVRGGNVIIGLTIDRGDAKVSVKNIFDRDEMDSPKTRHLRLKLIHDCQSRFIEELKASLEES
jgi:hypothetical protein